jgi:hypothetical protein
MTHDQPDFNEGQQVTLEQRGPRVVTGRFTRLLVLAFGGLVLRVGAVGLAVCVAYGLVPTKFALLAAGMLLNDAFVSFMRLRDIYVCSRIYGPKPAQRKVD